MLIYQRVIVIDGVIFRFLNIIPAVVASHLGFAAFDTCIHDGALVNGRSSGSENGGTLVPCKAIFCRDIPLHRPYIGLIYARY